MSDFTESESTHNESALGKSQQALRLIEATLPHLSGLARHIRLVATESVSVAAVAESGLTLVNPNVFHKIAIDEAMYVLAHEIMHLALDTHGRAAGADLRTVNIAHDYIINDMLTSELHRSPPLGGLYSHGASDRSLEEWIVELDRKDNSEIRCWSAETSTVATNSGCSSMSRALADAGLIPATSHPTPPEPIPSLVNGDLLDRDDEARFEPDVSCERRRELADETLRAATHVASLTALKEGLRRATIPGCGTGSLDATQVVEAVRSIYSPPWELVLQRWIDSVAPGQRDYSRASRRTGVRTDCVLPGRRRDGWTMHMVLDTSGSMSRGLPQALGAIAAFCESSGIVDIHIVQCDSRVTRNTWVDVSRLAEFEVAGFGGSNMSPAMRQLGEDPLVEAVLVLTDGEIQYPRTSPPYRVLWALTGDSCNSFAAPYGSVVRINSKSTLTGKKPI